ncbi:hypothetical protein WR25_22712 isoform B [Diploscapter pachys]|uniref:Uncharacterized protein n=1 Tax=Diploscapter pachys TaxID=2018661 RepID=A0A2A2M196_9BILA|nr:hypothetical protein WR25_22712 isoform B [Diploscapter pachys]
MVMSIFELRWLVKNDRYVPVPRAELPLIFQEEQKPSHSPSSVYHSASDSYHTAAAAYHTPISEVPYQPLTRQNPSIQSKPIPRFVGEIDELKRKRIEYVSDEARSEENHEEQANGRIEQLNVPEPQANRVYPQPRTDYTVRPVYKPVPIEPVKLPEPEPVLPPLAQLPEPGERVEPSPPAPSTNFNPRPSLPQPPPSFGISSGSGFGNSGSGFGNSAPSFENSGSGFGNSGSPFGNGDSGLGFGDSGLGFGSPPEELPSQPLPPAAATTTTTQGTTTTTTTEAPIEESTEAEAVGESTEGDIDNEPVPKPEPDANSGAIPGEDSGAGFGIGPSELPPEFANVGFSLGSGSGVGFKMPTGADEKGKKEEPTTKTPEKPSPPTNQGGKKRWANMSPEERREHWWKNHCTKPGKLPKRCNDKNRPKQRKQANANIDKEDTGFVIPQNSGLRPVSPPKEFADGGGFGSFGSGSGSSFGGGGGAPSGGFGIVPATEERSSNIQTEPEGAFATANGGSENSEGGDNAFTGDSALSPSSGPSGDGYGSAPPQKREPPPEVPSSFNSGRSPFAIGEATENPRTTVKPSALFSVLQKADEGFEQAINHLEQETPVESAAIDILEVALGSQKLDSQAKLLGHVDRTIGLDNLQRIQRWANTAGALDLFKEQFLKFAKNFKPPDDLFPTVPPQLEYLFKTSG